MTWGLLQSDCIDCCSALAAKEGKLRNRLCIWFKMSLLSAYLKRMFLKEKLKKFGLLGSPQRHLFVSLSLPDWPAEINKIPDSKYWPIRQRKERLIKGVGPTVGANPAILTFWIFDLKTPFQNKLTIKLTRKSSMSLPGRRSWLKQSGLHFDILFKTFITSSRCNTM